MADLTKIPSWDEAGNLRVVVEVPRGSNAKLKYDPKLEAFQIQRFIPGAGYPYDWGFVPSTLAEDGDPLDVLLVYDGHTWPGVVVPSIPIALLRVREVKYGESNTHRNDRLIAVPLACPTPCSLSELGSECRGSLERFFITAGELAKKSITIEGWAGPSDAAKAIARASTAFSKTDHRGQDLYPSR